MDNENYNRLVKVKPCTISVIVQNQPGVLGRIALVFSRRGFNIESLVVSASYKDGRFSKMTIVAEGNKKVLDQIIKQLKKLINVVHAREYFEESEILEREIALVKLKSRSEERLVLMQIIEHFNAKTIDLTYESVIIQIMGTTEKIDACIGMLKREDIVEVIRSGKVLMARGLEQT